MAPWHRVSLAVSRVRVWLFVLRARRRGERYFIEWDGERWSVIED